MQDQPKRSLIGHIQLLADIRRIEAASGVRVTSSHVRELRTHRVEAANDGDAQRFLAAAERIGLADEIAA